MDAVEPFILAEAGLLRLADWEEQIPGLSAGFTTRRWGNMSFQGAEEPDQVVRRRRQAAERLGLPFSGWTFAEQVHHAHVVRIDADLRGSGRKNLQEAIAGADGLSTESANTVLALLFADCVPLYFCVPERGVLALAHAGWRGTTKNMAASMLHHLQAHWNISPQEVWVAIGPSIGKCCYQVDQPVMDAVAKLLPHCLDQVSMPQAGERWLLDLKAVNRLLLLMAGVREENIWLSRYCTACHPELFYSYRKERQHAGRMMAWIGRREEEPR
ncbi:MAG: hypothetical protein BAA01_13135 [Bacillus thermozeamaize]|uniref:Purine nucleoside phosphorylase n=1 Tax=Bacillus thermozeamaize TaxID=230954 RepID=A0A1Y3PK32_9BACI|nr:MAG: hypothetical protein BAA01_13135 [Bacillus thermozeamaize]